MQQDESIRFAMSLIRCVSITVFALFVWHVSLSDIVIFQQAKNEELTALVAKKKTEVSLFENRQKRLVLLVSRLRFISELRYQNAKTSQLLDEVNKITPTTITLYQMQYQGHQMMLEGITKSDLQLIQFMDNIRKSAIFTQPEITQLNTAGQVRHFELKTWVKS